MLSNLNFWEIAGLALLGLFIFGPERLPKVIGDGVRMIRNLRDLARNATADLSRELGTEVRLEDLHPKAFIRKHLLSEEEERRLRRPFEDVYRDVAHVADDANEVTSRRYPQLSGPDGENQQYQVRPHEGQPRPEGPEPRQYDVDAT